MCVLKLHKSIKYMMQITTDIYCLLQIGGMMDRQTEDILAMVKKRKELRRSCCISRSSGLSRKILQSTLKKYRRRDIE